MHFRGHQCSVPFPGTANDYGLKKDTSQRGWEALTTLTLHLKAPSLRTSFHRLGSSLGKANTWTLSLRTGQGRALSEIILLTNLRPFLVVNSRDFQFHSPSRGYDWSQPQAAAGKAMLLAAALQAPNLPGGIPTWSLRAKVHPASPAVCSITSKQNTPPLYAGNKDTRAAQHNFQLVPASTALLKWAALLCAAWRAKSLTHLHYITKSRQKLNRRAGGEDDFPPGLWAISSLFDVSPRWGAPDFYTATTQHSREGRVLLGQNSIGHFSRRLEELEDRRSLLSLSFAC